MINNELHVIFGTGPVGLAVMDVLCEQGRRIRMVNRSGRSDAIPDGVEVVSGDVMNLDFTRRAAEGATHIYFALNPPYDKWGELFPTLQANVLEAAKQTGAKLILMENLYMYGDTHGAPLTEDLPYDAHTRKGKVRAQMAEAWMAAHRAGEIRAVAGRASDFVGPRVLDSMIGERVIPAALQGKAASIVGDPDKRHSYTYMPDIGRALVTLGENDAALGEAWHIPTAPAITTRAFIEKIYTEAGNPPKISTAPKPILWLMGKFNPIMNEVYEMLYEFEEDFVIDHSKYAAMFGDHATPVDTVVRETVNWYRTR